MKTLTVIITGASTGIGRAIAALFLKQGHNVVINAASENNLITAFNELGLHHQLAMVAGDISNMSTGKLLVETAIARFGAVDVLVNNAGIFEPRPFLEVDEAHLDKFLNINLKGTFFTTQAAITQMLKQDGGAILTSELYW